MSVTYKNGNSPLLPIHVSSLERTYEVKGVGGGACVTSISFFLEGMV